MQKQKIHELRKRILSRSKGTKWPLDLKEGILQLAFQLHAKGWYWRQIAKELELSREILFEWKNKAKEKYKGGFVAVIPIEKVEEKAKQTLVLYSKHGFELRGLDC